MYQELPSASPTIRCRWRAFVEEPGEYRVPASECWDISFIRRVDGSFAAELGGPSFSSRVPDSRLGESYWGLQLAPHAAFAGVDKAALLGRTVALPVDGSEFAIGGVRLAIPSWVELEDLVRQLLTAGLLVVDEHVRRALDGDNNGYSPRSWQRRFRQVTGLSRKQIEQLDRADRALVLLRRGLSPSDAAAAAGYADQSHLTRSLRLIRGRTPAQILGVGGAGW